MEGGNGELVLMGTELQFRKVKNLGDMMVRVVLAQRQTRLKQLSSSSKINLEEKSMSMEQIDKVMLQDIHLYKAK